MSKVFSLEQINAVLPDIDIIAEVARGFGAFSAGRVTVPPVGELLFPENSGELHIKYGAVKGDELFVIKVATGFFRNPSFGLPPFGGCMLVLSQRTGAVEAVLLEEGALTNHRTAAAGAVAAQLLAPGKVNRIGIVGAGVQARLQADYLRQVSGCRSLGIWARDSEKAKQAAHDIHTMGYNVSIEEDLGSLCRSSQLIVSTTPSNAPLITADMINPGTHITAMGSDTAGKNEIASDVLQTADLIVADSIHQCVQYGECHHAIAAGAITKKQIVELGSIVGNSKLGRTTDDQITLADLTGVAVQDIAIATAVYAQLTRQHC